MNDTQYHKVEFNSTGVTSWTSNLFLRILYCCSVWWWNDTCSKNYCICYRNNEYRFNTNYPYCIMVFRKIESFREIISDFKKW